MLKNTQKMFILPKTGQLFSMKTNKDILLSDRTDVFLHIVAQHLTKEHQVMCKLFQFVQRATSLVHLQSYISGFWQWSKSTSTSWNIHSCNPTVNQLN